MNIFVLQSEPRECAIDHCDKHVVKMHVEGVQMLVSVLNRYDIEHQVTTKSGTIHKGGHPHHPCTKWAGNSYDNFIWLIEYVRGLTDEHTYRYGTIPVSVRQTQEVVRYAHQVYDAMEREGCAENGLTPFALAMPNEFKCDDAVQSYRNLYVYGKSDIAFWKKNRPAPQWYLDIQKSKVTINDTAGNF